MHSLRTFWLLAVLAFAAAPLAGQAPTESALPRVFFDCDGPNCNSQYYRTEITWVNWVRDRDDSDVHVIVTSQGTGAGGREYQLDFIGEGEFEEYEDQIRYSTLPTDTDREELDGITNALAVGFARFAQEAGFRGLVSISGQRGADDAPVEGVVAADEVEDPWDLWVFRINGSANINGEDTRDTRRINSFVSASRVSPTWKINFFGNVNYNRLRIERTGEDDFINERTDYGFTQLVVYSLADHWSVGIRGEVRRIVSFNQDFRWEFTPGVEYSFFPYEEATRRALTFYYEIGPSYRDYIRKTAFGQWHETRFEQSMEIDFSQRQPWGDAGLAIRGSHFLHDLDLYNFSIRGDIDFRIVRGFSVNARANVGWVNDQIYLAGGENDSAEELLDLVRRAQSFTYGMQFGFSFQFGSIFNNVVNNRFGGGGFGGFFGGGGGGGR